MLREYKFYPILVTKDDLVQLIRLVNIRTNNNEVHLMMLDYQRFLCFVMQLSFNLYRGTQLASVQMLDRVCH
jgi:hypothetical protein